MQNLSATNIKPTSMNATNLKPVATDTLEYLTNYERTGSVYGSAIFGTSLFGSETPVSAGFVKPKVDTVEL